MRNTWEFDFRDLGKVGTAICAIPRYTAGIPDFLSPGGRWGKMEIKEGSKHISSVLYTKLK